MFITSGLAHISRDHLAVCYFRAIGVIWLCSMCLSYAWIYSSVDDRGAGGHAKHSRSLEALAQKWYILTSYWINANLNKYKVLFPLIKLERWNKYWGTGLVKWNWMLSYLVEKESTGKFPHMVTWQMFCPFDLDTTLLGVYPKQTEKCTKIGVQVHLVQ